eukprot:14530217-Heterocapsa_arctica.AAC.1
MTNHWEATSKPGGQCMTWSRRRQGERGTVRRKNPSRKAKESRGSSTRNCCSLRRNEDGSRVSS